jgi:hypothetical protein
VLDRRGSPIATTDTVKIKWILPEEPAQAFADRWLEVVALVPATGPANCTFRTSAMLPPPNQKHCDDLVRQNSKYKPSKVDTPFVMTIREEQLVEEGVAQPPAGEGLARVIVRKQVDANGYVKSCERVAEPLERVDSTPYLRCLVNERFEQLPETEPNRGDRLLTVTWMRSFAPAPAERR